MSHVSGLCYHFDPSQLAHLGKDDDHGSLEELSPTEQVFELRQKGMPSAALTKSIHRDTELERARWIPHLLRSIENVKNLTLGLV
jgi:hypothetical protein